MTYDICIVTAYPAEADYINRTKKQHPDNENKLIAMSVLNNPAGQRFRTLIISRNSIEQACKYDVKFNLEQAQQALEDNFITRLTPNGDIVYL